MIHNLIALTVLTTVAAVWYMTSPVRRGRAAARAAWADGADLLARAAAQPAERDPRCPRCRGRHCQPWRDSGADCGAQRHHHHQTMWTGGAGLHTPAAVFRRAVTTTWRPPRPAWSTLAERIGALPRVGVLP